MILKKITNLIFPKTCISCECIIENDQDICIQCFKKIDFLKLPYCISCGSIIKNNSNDICVKCMANPPFFSTAESVFAYDDNSKNIILRFKFFDNTIYIKTCAKWMYNKNPAIFSEIHYIIPIPLNKKKLVSRKYNQAALLSQEISKYSKIPVELFAVKKIKDTIPQAELSMSDRMKNLTDAFHVSNKELVKNKNIILIDDVITTGATLNRCSEILIKSGAKEVRVLTLARTINN